MSSARWLSYPQDQLSDVEQLQSAMVQEGLSLSDTVVVFPDETEGDEPLNVSLYAPKGRRQRWHRAPLAAGMPALILPEGREGEDEAVAEKAMQDLWRVVGFGQSLYVPAPEDVQSIPVWGEYYTRQLALLKSVYGGADIDGVEGIPDSCREAFQQGRAARAEGHVDPWFVKPDQAALQAQQNTLQARLREEREEDDSALEAKEEPAVTHEETFTSFTKILPESAEEEIKAILRDHLGNGSDTFMTLVRETTPVARYGALPAQHVRVTVTRYEDKASDARAPLSHKAPYATLVRVERQNTTTLHGIPAMLEALRNDQLLEIAKNEAESYFRHHSGRTLHIKTVDPSAKRLLVMFEVYKQLSMDSPKRFDITYADAVASLRPSEEDIRHALEPWQQKALLTYGEANEDVLQQDHAVRSPRFV